MEDSYEQRIQNQFGGFCTRVLKNEANHIHNEYTWLQLKSGCKERFHGK